MKQLKSRFAIGVFVAGVQLVSAQTIFNPFPSRIVGQPFLQQIGAVTADGPNLVEGRELFQPQALAVDNSVSPPILYVADYLNNRVLAWKNAAGFQKGDFADLVIGQRDRYSRDPRGPVPGSDLSTGLYQPVGLAVDSKGNLYVADTGNNRVMRYPTPFQQNTQLLSPDLVLGQKDFNSRAPNQGLSNPTEKTLSIQNQFIGIAFDNSGNLWVSDGVNNRVLRYPASSLGSQAAFDPAADVVLGQPDFLTTAIPKDFNVVSKTTLSQPGAIAFSPSGVMFVADSAAPTGRVVVYVGPFTTAQAAARIMGVVPVASGAPAPSPLLLSQTTFSSANGIFFMGETPFIVDTGKSRILQFDIFANWPLESVSFSPVAVKAYGQSGWEVPGSVADLPNAGNPTSSDSTFAFPASALIVGTDLIVADSGNNRVVAIPNFPALVAQSAQFPFFRATRLLGQLDFQYNSPNLIEGREVSFSIAGGAVALDLVSSTAHLYVADAANNRVLGFKDARTVQPGQKADIVIGQPDFLTAISNYPDGRTLSDSSLARPEGVTVDSKGDLWVADTGNGRVLRFPRPFDQASTTLPHANLVIGQATFSSKITDASSQTMSAPYAIAFTAEGHLAVSDLTLNRVLFFHRPSGGDFVNGQAAINVIGQPDFQPGGTVETNPMNGPRGIAIDPNFDRLYVSDTGNNRILVYRNLPTAERDPAPSIILTGDGTGSGFNKPVGVAVDQYTGELWVADTVNNRVVRFPSFDTLLTSPVSNFTLNDSSPVALTLDAFGNPVIAEGINRIAFYYHAIGSNSGNCATCSGNAANYFARFAPGMLATLKPSANSTFGTATAVFSNVPLPTSLGDIQVIVGANLPSGGVAAPLLYVSPTQINFQVPTSFTPGSNLVEFDVVKVSTNQILAAWLYRIESYSPGLFTVDSTGSGALRAENQDNSINDATHPAKAGSTIQLFGTGQGAVTGGPPDGTLASGTPATLLTPRVLINGFDSPVSYSGLAPGLVGVWQINAVVPANVPPGKVSVVVLMNDVASNIDPLTGVRITQTIYTTQ